jgi:zinc transport system permease protein
MGILETLVTYLSYSFVVNALVVGTLIALCSSLLGTTLVMKRLSFIGDGLSHVAFGAYAIAAVAHLSNNMLITAPVTILVAILLLRRSSSNQIKGDAAMTMLSVGSLAFGYLLMNVFSTSSNVSGDVCSSLFGSTSILTLTDTEVALAVVLSAVVVILFVLMYNRIFAVTFDESFAKATGLNTGRYNLLIAVMVALVIVLGMSLVGSLLISALVVFPALSAMRLYRSFLSVTICAAVLSVLSALGGIISSILAGTPAGSTIVAINILVFLLCQALGSLAGKSAK